MAYSRELVNRVREALGARPSGREVKMFGGLVFMVNDAMVVCAMSNGDLLVRADPQRSDDLLTRTGARQAEMGGGRTMGKGWIAVDEEALATDEDLRSWLEVALGYNETKTGADRPEHGRKARAP